MQTIRTPDPDPLDALPIPGHTELIGLSLRLEQLQASGEVADAILAARRLDYVASLLVVARSVFCQRGAR